MHPFEPESTHQCLGDSLGGPAVCQDPAQHGSKSQNQHQQAQGVPDAFLQGLNGVFQRQPHGEAHKNADHDKGEKSIEFRHRNQQQEQNHSKHRNQ